jgi:hypothetical protein
LPEDLLGPVTCVLDRLANGGREEIEFLGELRCVFLRKCPAPTVATQFRPIVVASVILKLYEIVLGFWLEEVDQVALPEDMFALGFRPGYQVVEKSWCLQQLLQHRADYGEQTLVAKLDVAKAFDTVEYSRMIQSMQKREVPTCVIAAYIRLLCVCSMRVHLDSGQVATRSFCRKRGVWQSGMHSPRIYRWVHRAE